VRWSVEAFRRQSYTVHRRQSGAGLGIHLDSWFMLVRNSALLRDFSR
jgi:hypothetical protein